MRFSHRTRGCGRRSAISLALTGCLLALSPQLLCAGIGDAVDATNLTWTTGGDASWLSQTTDTHDGVDAAASGTITSNQVSWIQTSVTGPGVLVFWWKVSSETNYDYLRFYTNAVLYTNSATLQEASISGEIPWERLVVELPGGSRTLRWSYEKDEDISEGQDRGWLDEVRFYTNQIPPIIPVEPDPTTTVGQGGPVTLKVRVLGTEPMSYQWKRFGTNLTSSGRISGAQTNALTISPVTAADIGTYTLAASNAYGTVVSRAITLYTFDQVLETTTLQWTYGGDVNWEGQTNVTHDNVDAAISGAITDGQSSWIRATATGPGTVSFWWKVDSESGAPVSGDGLEFRIDGLPQLYLSGLGIDWTNQIASLTAGSHTLEWRYAKDFIYAFGQDRGWLDQVVFTPNAPLPFSVSPAGFSGGAFQVNLQGQPGRVYRLYWSSNLLNWVPVQTNSDPSGLVPFTDPSAPGRARGYYRGETDAN